MAAASAAPVWHSNGLCGYHLFAHAGRSHIARGLSAYTTDAWRRMAWAKLQPLLVCTGGSSPGALLWICWRGAWSCWLPCSWFGSPSQFSGVLGRGRNRDARRSQQLPTGRRM